MKQKDFYNTSAWKYFSRYILLYYSNNNVVQCSTCGKWYILPNKYIHCGHLYKSDKNRGIALDFHNAAPQCYRCNVYFSGQPDKMRDWLIKKHGIENMDRLIVRKNIAKKLDKFELDVYKEHYKTLFNELVRKKKNPWKNNQ